MYVINCKAVRMMVAPIYFDAGVTKKRLLKFYTKKALRILIKTNKIVKTK